MGSTTPERFSYVPHTLKKERRSGQPPKDTSVFKLREKAAKVRWQIESETAVSGTPESTGCSTEEPSSSKDVDTKAITQRQLNRIKCRLAGLIPSYPLNNLEVFFQYLPYSKVPGADLLSAKYQFMGTFSA